MAESGDRLRRLQGGAVGFHCPGCKDFHAIPVTGSTWPGKPWTWNGDTKRPTLTPSILDTHRYGEPVQVRVCHSFVTDGRIQFLGDSTHALANQTVDIPEAEGEWGGEV
jgi:hypothetical protein